MLDQESTILYRPAGQREFELIRDSGFHKFPPRLSHQPIFYPVLEFDYAAKIAREWNSRDEFSGRHGYVLRFRVRNSFLSRYELRQVGDRIHREYWIPAEDLADMNANVLGIIECVAEFDEGSG